MNRQELEAISSLISEAEESAKLQRDVITDDLLEKNINVEKLEQLVREDNELGIQNYSMELTEEIYRQIKNVPDGTEPEETSFDERKALVDYGVKSIQEMLSSESDLKELKEEVNGEIKSYADYISSEAYDLHRQKNIETWKSMLEHEKDAARAMKLRKAIYTVEERFTLGFMFADLNDPKTHDREKRSLVSSFFDSKRSNYNMEKFFQKCKQFGYSRDICKYILDIEERYLEEKYHVFNNFFLFSAIRFIAHAGLKEINQTKEVIQCMLNLVYNRFYSDEVRDLFLNSIRSFLDQFMDQRELFEKDNILHPGHPHRIQKKAEKEKEIRKNIYVNLTEKELCEVNEELRKELDEMSIEELIAFYQKKLDEKENPPKVEPEKDAVVEEANGGTNND